MIILLLILLFIGLLVCFYLIALLHMKIAKFDALELKQRKLMEEMDNAIGAYLSEVRDENDELLEQITEKIALIQSTQASATASMSAEMPKNVQEVVEESQNQRKKAVAQAPHSMRHYARKTYTTMGQLSREETGATQGEVEKEQVENHPTQPLSEREQVLKLAAEGNSVEDIAKRLGKGKTEVELILKFS